MIIRDLAIGAAAAFLINLAWENAQAPLYAGYAGFWRRFPMCATAALGDVVLVVLLYLAVAIVARDANWFIQLRWRHVLTLSMLGLLAAIAVERWALDTARWSYAGMPTILDIGVLPLLQMMIVPLGVFYLLHTLHRRL